MTGLLRSHKVGFIGAGRVGQTLAQALSWRDVEVIGFHSRTLASAQRASARVGKGAEAFPFLDSLLERASLLFVTVNDDALPTIAQHISRTGVSLKGKVFIHTNGGCGVEVLAPLEERGAEVAALHPLQSFPLPDELGLERLPGIYWTYEIGAPYPGKNNPCPGPRVEVKALVLDIVAVLEGKPISIDPSKKVLYHAAAVMASNYLVTLIHAAQVLLIQAGFQEREAQAALAPLVQGTLRNIDELGTREALTGPVSRGDVAAVKRHVEELRRAGSSPEAVAFYKTLGRATLDLARPKKKLTADQERALIEILS